MVEAFLGQYVEAFNARDGSRIASLYNVPCVTVRADASIHAFTSPEQLREFFQRLADTYHRDGARAWQHTNLQVQQLGAKSSLATLDWEMQRADGSAIRRWRQSYNFVLADGRLRILTSTIHA